MSAGGGQGNWGPWPVVNSTGNPLPGQVKIDAGDASPGFLGVKVESADGSIVVAVDAGPPEMLNLEVARPTTLVLPYAIQLDEIIPPDGYIYTGSLTEFDSSPGSGVGEYPVPPGFVASQVLLSVKVTDNVLVAASGPPPTVNFTIQPYRNGVAINGTQVVYTTGQLTVKTNSLVIVGAVGDTFGLAIETLGLDPAQTQRIAFNAMLVVKGK